MNKLFDKTMYDRLENLIRPKENDKFSEVYEMVDNYRILCKMTWWVFIWTCISYFIRRENPALSSAIDHMIANRPKPGRPTGTGLKANMRRLGVLPDKEM